MYCREKLGRFGVSTLPGDVVSLKGSPKSNSSSERAFRGDEADIELPSVAELARELVEDGRGRYGLRSPMSSSYWGGSRLSWAGTFGGIDDDGAQPGLVAVGCDGGQPHGGCACR